MFPRPHVIAEIVDESSHRFAVKRLRLIGVCAAALSVGTLALALPASQASATTPATITLVAGGGGSTPSTTPTTPATSFNIQPVGIAFDSSGNEYIADGGNGVEKVTPSGALSMFAGGGTHSVLSSPLPPGAATSYTMYSRGVAVDPDGNVYIADGESNTVDKVTPAGILTVITGAGTHSPISSPLPPGPAASYNNLTPYAVATDSSGNLYIGDDSSNDVLKVTPAGTLSVYAGDGTYGAPTSGAVATATSIGSPYGLAVDSSGNVFIADEGSELVEKVSPAGIITIVAGSVNSYPYPSATPQAATSVNLDQVYGVGVDYLGNVYIGDKGNYEVYQVTPAGQITVLAGNGGYPPAPTTTPGSPLTAYDVGWPVGLGVDSAGNLFIADHYNDVVDEINFYNAPLAPTAATTQATSSTVQVSWSPGAGPTPASYTVTPIVNGVPGPPVTVTGTTYSVPAGPPGTTYSFTIAANSINGSSASDSSNTATVPAASSGYWTVGGDGGVFSFGPTFYGSTGSLTLNQPVFAITSTTDGKGYWFVARDGGVFAYGDGVFHGSVPALGIPVSNIVGMAADTATGGYWLVGSDGGVYAFDAPFAGSVPGLGQHVSTIVGMAATADGGGYYLVGSNGSVYPFGDAHYQGGANTTAHLNAPIVGISVDSATGGYWLAGSDGGVYAYGAPFEGSAGGTTLNAPVVGISATTDGSGYYLVAADGGVSSYNAPFLGSMGGKHLNAPMVGMAVAG